jgi:hypothetical protein
VAQYYIEENPGNYITWNSQSLMFSKCQLSTGNGQYYYFDRYPYTAVKMSDPTGTYTEAQPSGVNTTTHGFYIDSTA